MPISKQQIVEKALSEVDLAAWKQLHTEYEGKNSVQCDVRSSDKIVRLERNYSKYFDLDTWIQYHARHAMTVGLHLSDSPKRVLDLGCGAGIFLFVCRVLGHHGIGLDLESAMYQRMASILEVDWRASPIMAKTPLPASLDRFDLISAIAIKFDRLDYGPQDAEPWNLSEWEFFLRDAATRLKPAGRLFIKPNFLIHPTETAPGVFFKDPRIMELLERVSARVTPNFEFLIPKSSLV